MKIEYHRLRVVEKLLASELNIYGVECRVCAQDIVKAISSRGMFDPAKEDLVFLRIQKYHDEDTETYLVAMKIVEALDEFEISVGKAIEELSIGDDDNEKDENDNGSSLTPAEETAVDTSKNAVKGKEDNKPYEYKLATKRNNKNTPKLTMMKACLYTRVNTETLQNFEENGVEPNILERLRSWCDVQGWEVVETLVDDTDLLSNKQEKLEGAVKDHRRWNVLVVDKRSTLAVYGFEYLRMLVESQGSKIVVVNALDDDLKFDTRTVVDDLYNKWSNDSEGDGEIVSLLQQLKNKLGE